MDLEMLFLLPSFFFLVFDFLEKGREYEMKTFWSFLFFFNKKEKKINLGFLFWFRFDRNKRKVCKLIWAVPL